MPNLTQPALRAPPSDSQFEPIHLGSHSGRGGVTRPAHVALLFVLAGAFVAPLRADVAPAPLFSDGAVLQREKPVAIWGKADRGEKVVVSFAGQRLETTAGHDGRWLVRLDPLTASSQGADLVIAGNNTVTLRDILVGEVWLCSGQSNMEWAVSRALNGAQEAAAAKFPQIRHIKIERTVAEKPAETVPTTGWKAATPANTGAFTAVGYFFARELHQKLGVPIGIINSTWGGTPIESWMSAAALASDPAFAVVAQRWRQSVAEFPRVKDAYDRQLPGWTAGEAAAQKKGPIAVQVYRRANPRPRTPRGRGHPWTPSSLYHGMIHPLLPYGLRGALWYQGESNAERPSEYAALFARMITSWREAFGQGDVPFYWVNLANFDPPEDPTGLTYASLREAQTKTLGLPNTGQALAIDIGDPLDIHPLNKQEVGRRLALLARNRVYDLVADDTGPTFAKVTREGPALRVHFTHAANGLIAYDATPQALQIAGSDRVFHPASGKIERDTMVVSSPLVPEPVAVRYAWHNIPAANLYNGAGLPAVPFRSDDW